MPSLVTPRSTAALILVLLVIAVPFGAVAQGVTIGGTPTDAEGDDSGLTAMFGGDLFDNFRNMDRLYRLR